MPNTTKLAELHDLVVEMLLGKIRSGEISSTDLKTAVQLLRDNGITAEVTPGSPMAILGKELDVSKLPYSVSKAA